MSSGIDAKAAVTWQDYVDELLMASGHVAHAAIHRLPDGAALATTEHIRLTTDQVADILRGFTEPVPLYRTGLSLGDGRRYTLTRVSDGRIMVGREAARGHGCVLYRGQRCLLVAVYEDAQPPGACYSLLVGLGDFLLSSGF